MRTAVRTVLGTLGLLSTTRSLYRSIAGLSRDMVWYVARILRRDLVDPHVPPPSLCFRSAVSYDPDHFVSSGETGADSVMHLLSGIGRPLESFGDILDFGCGCCRITRHLLPLREGVNISASDIDRRAVEWVLTSLPQLDTRLHAPGESLPFGDSQFDLVLAIAVFPLMNLEHQALYLEEIRRVMKTGGILLLTLKGSGRRQELSGEALTTFDNGRPVVIEPRSSGSIYCLAYHPEEFVRNDLSAGFRVLLHQESGSADTNQDAWLLERASQEIDPAWERKRWSTSKDVPSG